MISLRDSIAQKPKVAMIAQYIQAGLKYMEAANSMQVLVLRCNPVLMRVMSNVCAVVLLLSVFDSLTYARCNLPRSKVLASTREGLPRGQRACSMTLPTSLRHVLHYATNTKNMPLEPCGTQIRSIQLLNSVPYCFFLV